jgi:hypothetical protein
MTMDAWMSDTALQRDRTQNSSRMKPDKRNFFSIYSGLTGPRGARFSPPVNVITFLALIHLTAIHQSSSLETFKINNRRSRLAA